MNTGRSIDFILFSMSSVLRLLCTGKQGVRSRFYLFKGKEKLGWEGEGGQQRPKENKKKVAMKVAELAK